MSDWLHYIDNEVPAEWDLVVQDGSSTIVQIVAAAWPERGQVGLRLTIVGISPAYVAKNLSVSLSAAGSIFVGLWIKLVSANPASSAKIVELRNGGNVLARLTILNNGNVKATIYEDGDADIDTTISTVALTIARWHYLAVELKRASSNVASDGGGAAFIDGQLASSRYDVDNFDRAVAVDAMRIGEQALAGNGDVIDFDEIKVQTSYPEPYVPTPATNYLEAARTIVLYRATDADSVAFADYCVANLGIPQGNLCPLPNASANETLADYATFQSEVETDLAAWLSRNPTVNANKMCFVRGYGVPAFFDSAGIAHSAVSRLMNYGTAFSSGTANPLYNPSTPTRISKSDLDTAGVFFACEFDADTLQHAKDIVDAGLTVDGLSVLAATDVLYGDDSTYLTSLNCQHLRIATAALASYANDAFVWGDTGTPAFGSAGSRVCFTDDSADSASSLRSGSCACRTALNNSYAAAIGFSASPCSLVPGPFFEVLRLGGTLAEAAAVAIEKLDYTAVTVGSPLMTASFQLGGYNAYMGVGSVAAIDFTTIVAYLLPGVTAPQLVGLVTQEYTDYWFGVRAVSSAGVEETNTEIVTRVRIENGQLITPPPNDIDAQHVSVEVAAGGKLRLYVFYNARDEQTPATGIQVAKVYATPDGLTADWQNLLETIAISGMSRVRKLLDTTFIDAENVRLAVRAVTADGTPGGQVILSPVAADATAPGSLTYVEAAQIG